MTRGHGGRPVRVVGLLGAAALAAVLQLAPISPVRAAETGPIAGGSWYWQPQIASLNTPAGPLALPTGPLPTPDVPIGDFAVTAILGQPNKETYVHLAGGITKGATVEQLKLVLKESTAGMNLLASTAKIAAYPVIGFFSDGSSAGVWDQRPSFDPSVSAPGTRAADGTWRFDLTGIAKKWADGSLANNGVALAGAGLAAPETWQVVWSGASPRPFTEGLVRLPPVEPAASGAAAEQAAEAPAEATAPADALEGLPAVVATPSTAGATSTPPAAATEKQSTQSARLRGVLPAVSKGRVKRAPPLAFYLAVAAVLGLLVLGGIALGERGEPLPERRGSVLRTLERRTEQDS